MKILSKIKAFFKYRNQDAELTVSAAEVRNGRVFLHPEDDPTRIFCIKSSAVDILISPQENIREEDLEIIEVKQPERVVQEVTPGAAPFPPNNEPEKQPKPETHKLIPATGQNFRRRPLSFYMPKMKTVSFKLYPEEYDMLMSSMRENGYKKTEFLLACVSSAKKNSMEATYHKYAAAHKERRLTDRQAAKRAQEAEYHARQQHAV